MEYVRRDESGDMSYLRLRYRKSVFLRRIWIRRASVAVEAKLKSSCAFCKYERKGLRKFDMFRRLFLANDPFLPFRTSILHCPEDDVQYLESGIPETHC